MFLASSPRRRVDVDFDEDDGKPAAGMRASLTKITSGAIAVPSSMMLLVRKAASSLPSLLIRFKSELAFHAHSVLGLRKTSGGALSVTLSRGRFLEKKDRLTWPKSPRNGRQFYSRLALTTIQGAPSQINP